MPALHQLKPNCAMCSVWRKQAPTRCSSLCTAARKPTRLPSFCKRRPCAMMTWPSLCPAPLLAEKFLQVLPIVAACWCYCLCLLLPLSAADDAVAALLMSLLLKGFEPLNVGSKFRCCLCRCFAADACGCCLCLLLSVCSLAVKMHAAAVIGI